MRAGELLAAADRGDFPSTLYLEGSCEPIKAALLAELRAAWKRQFAGAPVRVFRAAETDLEQVLTAFQGASLFDPRELLIVLEIEDWGRGEKRLAALAAGLGRGGETSSLVLVESAAETPRKALAPVRDACRVHVDGRPPMRVELSSWGARRLAREGLETEPGVIDALVEACEGDPLAFFNELDKLCAYAGGAGRVRREDAAALLRPAVGAELPDYLAAVAMGQAGIASQKLGRILAAGVSEGSALWALGNLVGGALGGWARDRNASETLRRRASAAGLARALDAIYRAEAAWKGGRADAVAALEQATREVCVAR
jgi:DNA polymerase III delta subunit